MKIVCVTQDEPFYLPVFWDLVFAERGADIVGLSVLSPDSRPGLTARRHYGLWGPWLFLLHSLLFAAFRCADLLERVFRIRLERPFSAGSAARRYGIKVLETNDINSEDFLCELEKAAPDVIVSVAASQVFKKRILSLPPLGCVNVHSALLPRYRGMLPSFWVLYNNEKETGVTVHYMDEKLDSGDIILQERVPVDESDTQHTIILKTKRTGVRLLLRALDLLEKGAVSALPNYARQAACFSFPTRKEAREFRKRGKRFR